MEFFYYMNNMLPSLKRAVIFLLPGLIAVALVAGCGSGGGGSAAGSQNASSGGIPPVTNGFEIWDFNYTPAAAAAGKMCIKFNGGSTYSQIANTDVFINGYLEAADLSGTIDASGSMALASGSLSTQFSANVNAAATLMSGTYSGTGLIGSGSFSGGRITGKYSCFWEPFGTASALNVDTANKAELPVIAMDGDYPFVAFIERVLSPPVNGSSFIESKIYVKRWNGTQWVQLGGSLNTANNDIVVQPYLAVANGKPVVAWSERNKNTLVYEAYAKRWDGAAWVSLGGLINNPAGDDTYAKGVVLDNSDRPVILLTYKTIVGYSIRFDSRAMQWDGSSWIQLGGSFSDAWGYHMAKDPAGAPIFVAEFGLSLGAVKWNASNSAWDQIGGVSFPSIGTVKSAEIAYTGSGAPVIVFDTEAALSSYINIITVVNGNWVQLISGVPFDPVYSKKSPHIAIDPTDGRLVVAAATNDSGGIVIKKAYTDQWKEMGSNFDNYTLYTSQSPVIAFDSAGKLYAASSQQPTSSQSNIVLSKWPSQN